MNKKTGHKTRQTARIRTHTQTRNQNRDEASRARRIK